MLTSENIVKAVHWLDKYRKKIILLLLLPLITAVGVYYKSNLIIDVLRKPLKGLQIFFLTPIEGIMVKITVALVCSLIITIPIIAYIMVFMFSFKISKKLRNIIRFIIIPFATLSFIGGICFGYRFVLPVTIDFLLNCGNEFMKPTLRGHDCFSFIILLLISIGILFELPLILVALSRIGIINSKKLMNKRKIAIFSIFVIAAVATPTPDVFTLTIVALPMIVLYEISIWCIYIIERGNKKNGR
jgi:sec-independent protein translocase protein TatC